MHIGIVEYINALPFHLPYHLGALHCEDNFTYAVPSTLNSELRAGRLDMALTSCIEYFQGPYHMLPGFCLAAHKEILSVNLYTRGSLDGARIGVTSQSATSVALLRVLCHTFWKAEPHFVPFLNTETYDGFLLIGDDALKQREIPGYETIDLAAAWYEATGLPFVFAVVAVREGVEANGKPFAEALEWSEANRTQLVEAAHVQCGLPKHLINRYYDLCFYRLGEQELEGLEHFKRLNNDVSKICT